MLPPTLSEELCSLNAGVDKLTFSVIFTLTAEGKLVKTWFGRTIIKCVFPSAPAHSLSFKRGAVLIERFAPTHSSKVKLAYSDAQEVIDGKGLPAGKIEDVELREGVENDVKALAVRAPSVCFLSSTVLIPSSFWQGIAKHLRANRFDSGALRIDNVKVSFKVGADGMPIDSHAYERKEANELIEEVRPCSPPPLSFLEANFSLLRQFMLLANISVAGKIASGLPDQSLLRRHESPIDRRLEAFTDRMKRLGIDLDPSSSKALMQSIAAITDPSERLTLQHLSTRSMQRAKYFCTGMLDISKYRHYALNVPLYTHFTSPIRRYADIMVHRQLEAVLAAEGGEARFPLDAEAVSKVAQTCNIKKEAARLAQEQSQHLFLCVLIADLTKRYGPVIRYGTVIGVLDQAFDVLVSDFGVEKRVHVDQMPVEVRPISCPSPAYSRRPSSFPSVSALDSLLRSDTDSHSLRSPPRTTNSVTPSRSFGKKASTSSPTSPRLRTTLPSFASSNRRNTIRG
jgi:protein SSD1